MQDVIRSEPRTAADGALCDNYNHKVLHLGCYSSPRSASGNNAMIK